jgi:uncharacterized delta-60 repeat protein
MNILPRPLHIVALLLLASASAVRSLTVAPAGAANSETAKASLAMVEGRPAIAWADGQAAAIKYARALDGAGAAWGTPVTVDTSTAMIPEICLRTVNGNPAVCYFDAAMGKLMFARASDSTGSVWSPPVSLFSSGLARHITMEIVGGNPAIAFQSGIGNLMYRRSTTPDGSTWAPVVTADIFPGLTDLSMKIVEGNPAIAYTSSSHVLFVRALDPAGAAWGPRLPVTPAFLSTSCSMQIVGGRPAICFSTSVTGGLTYVRALVSDGRLWQEPVTLAPVPVTPFHTSLAVVNGHPAIAFFSPDPFSDLKYVQALDGTGDTSQAWGPVATVDSVGDTGHFPSLLEVDGRPSIACVDVSRAAVKYLRAMDGGILWPADILVQDKTGAAIPGGGTMPFGVVGVGSKKSVALAPSNPNSGGGVLNISGLTIDGPDAAEFSILTLPATPLDGESSSEFTVQYAPLTPGIKTATLHIASDSELSPGPYDITLTGESVPDISVEWPAGTSLTVGSSLSLPVIAAGTTRDLVFTVRNPGGAELNELALTIDGPDTADFPVVTFPASVLAPGAATTFSLRLAPLSAGGKTVSLHLDSNVAGDKNPFYLTFRMVPGSVDESYHLFVNPDHITGIAVQADGRILTTGASRVEASNPDGSPDTAFFAPAVDPSMVNCVAVQKDGRILIGGTFTLADGQSRSGLVRVLTDGTLDDSFVPDIDAQVTCLIVQPDGKIVAGGVARAGQTSPWVARFHADGSLDAAFAPVPNATPWCFALQPDGKILVGGEFTAFDGRTARGIARLNPNGTVDETFAGDIVGLVWTLALLPDGRILAGSESPGGIVRLFSNGARDPAMTLNPDGRVEALAMQADGKCIMAGEFRALGGTARGLIARINLNGSLDPSFDPNANGASVPGIHRVALQADGKVLITGDFSTVGDTGVNRFARLDNDPAFTTLQVSGNSTLRWLRSGAAPDVRDVTFDAKPSDSSDWTRLGNGTRIPGGWELSGLTLPASGQIRARGYAGGSVMESVLSLLTPLESWRLQYFNTSENTGDAADDADPDHDGLTNFTEYAFGLSPVDRTGNALPEFKYSNNVLTATFTAPEGREDVAYSAEWSATMLPGTWTNIPDTGTAGAHTFTVPGTAPRVFVRYALKMR